MIVRTLARWILVGGVLLAAGPATAADERASSFGFGYDRGSDYSIDQFGGLGLRYHWESDWGISFRMNPSYRISADGFLRFDSRISSSEEFQSDRDGSDDSDSVGFQCAAGMFHESRIGQWLGVGPFAEISYHYSRRTDDETYVTLESDGDVSTRSIDETTRTHGVSLLLGVRPTFHLSEHVVLETRFGFGVRFSDYSRTGGSIRVDTSGGGQSSSDSSSERESQRWDAGAFGESLGLSSILSFMIYI